MPTNDYLIQVPSECNQILQSILQREGIYFHTAIGVGGLVFCIPKKDRKQVNEILKKWKAILSKMPDHV